MATHDPTIQGYGAALTKALRGGQRPPVAAFGQLAALNLQAGNLVEAEKWTREGLKRHGASHELWDLLGVILRRAHRLTEARAALERAAKINATDQVRMNLANVYNDLADGDAALAILAPLAAREPDKPDLQRRLARAHWRLGDMAATAAALDLALRAAADDPGVWVERATLWAELQEHRHAIATLDQGLAQLPRNASLLTTKARLMSEQGQGEQAEDMLLAEQRQNPNQTWILLALAGTCQDVRPSTEQDYLRKALALEPANPAILIALALSLDGTLDHREGQALDEALKLVMAVMRDKPVAPTHWRVIARILSRMAALGAVEQLGSFAELGRYWALNGGHTDLLYHLARISGDADRRELLAQHRAWGHTITRRAAANEIVRRAPAKRDRVRLGFLSSDLRQHPVGRFAYPLFEHVSDRFEIFAYSSYPRAVDPEAQWIAGHSTYRYQTTLSHRGAAQQIADDQLDVLIELGASTKYNRPQVLGFKPARLQASWLGYPHSLGLETLDGLILDPMLVPPDPSLLIEQPWLMPSTWIAMGPKAFPPSLTLQPIPPQTTAGHTTFGTANNPYKYNLQTLAAWARVLKAVPGSRFLFVRPEGRASAFRANILAAFAGLGVEADRIEFESSRGSHMSHYGRIDVALDCLPQTGGTTTCEALWMGVPTVSLVGPALFERLSASILTNVGLGDLVASSIDDYVAKAVTLAADLARRAHLRGTIRQTIAASPLGQTEQFAADFYSLIERQASGISSG